MSCVSLSLIKILKNKGFEDMVKAIYASARISAHIIKSGFTSLESNVLHKKVCLETLLSCLYAQRHGILGNLQSS